MNEPVLSPCLRRPTHDHYREIPYMEVSRPDQSQKARPDARYKRRDVHQFHSSEGIPLYSKQLEEEEELEIDTKCLHS